MLTILHHGPVFFAVHDGLCTLYQAHPSQQLVMIATHDGESVIETHDGESVIATHDGESVIATHDGESSLKWHANQAYIACKFYAIEHPIEAIFSSS
jgi:hypothetical protein